MSTIKDVAALAGVAPSTVSNVFTKKKYVSPKVTRKVREACEQLNYTPSFLASGMRTQKTSLIGLMLSSAAGGFQEFYHYFIEGATIAAAECGYSVILYYEVTDKEKLQAIFASGRGPIEGAVLLTPRTGDFRFIEMETNNIPYVLVGREFLGGGATFVDVCNDTITYEIVSRLIGEGRRNFVFLNSAEELYISQDRLKGFNRALREAGIPVSRARVESVLAADAAAAAARLITEKTDAVIVESDVCAAGVYEAMAERGLSHEKIKVCALGGETVAHRLDPPVTTVHVDYRSLADTAVRLLVRRLRGEECPRESYAGAEILYR